MGANVAATNGLCLAEAVSFALSRHMSRSEAQALVTACCGEVLETGRHLVDLVSQTTDAPVDWDAVRRPENWLGSAADFVAASLGGNG